MPAQALSGSCAGSFATVLIAYLLDILKFCGQWPLTMRAWCSAFRYCPDPLGIVTAKQLDKLEFIQFLLLHLQHEILL